MRFIQSDRDFEVRLIDVQHQSGSSDCSLFAVAFAQVLCAGLDPHLTTFDQKSMREHLFSSFEDGELLPFSPCTETEAPGKEKSRAEAKGSSLLFLQTALEQKGQCQRTTCLMPHLPRVVSSRL